MQSYSSINSDICVCIKVFRLGYKCLLNEVNMIYDGFVSNAFVLAQVFFRS